MTRCWLPSSFSQPSVSLDALLPGDVRLPHSNTPCQPGHGYFGATSLKGGRRLESVKIGTNRESGSTTEQVDAELAQVEQNSLRGRRTYT